MKVEVVVSEYGDEIIIILEEGDLDSDLISTPLSMLHRSEWCQDNPTADRSCVTLYSISGNFNMLVHPPTAMRIPIPSEYNTPRKMIEYFERKFPRCVVGDCEGALTPDMSTCPKCGEDQYLARNGMHLA